MPGLKDPPYALLSPPQSPYICPPGTGDSPMSPRLPLFLAAFAVLSAPLSPASAQERDGARRVPTSPSEIRLSYAPIVKRARPPSSTSSHARRDGHRRPLLDDPFFRRFFGDQRRSPARANGSSARSAPASSSTRRASSSPTTTSSRGADEMTVSLADRREFEARVVLADQRTDLAVLRIEGQRRAAAVARFRRFRRISRSATSCSRSATRSASARP